MEIITIKVEGMTCNHCVSRVKEAIKALEGVIEVDVRLEEKNATVKFDDSMLSPENIVEAVNNIGYKAQL